MRKIFTLTFRHSNLVIAVNLLITVFFGYQLKNIIIDPSAENLVPQHSRVIEMLEKYETDSSLRGYFLFAVESDNLFTIEGLQAFENAIREVEQLPGISPSVNPFSTMTFVNEGKRLEVRPLAPGGRAPGNREDLEKFRNNLLNNPFYTGSLISGRRENACRIISMQTADG